VGIGILWPWVVRTAWFSAVLILTMAHKRFGMRAFWGRGARPFLGITYRPKAAQWITNFLSGETKSSVSG